MHCACVRQEELEALEEENQVEEEIFDQVRAGRTVPAA